MLFDSDCQNINTSQEFSPLADRSHYKIPFAASKIQNVQADKFTTSEKSERNNESMCSRNSKNSKTIFRTSLNITDNCKNNKLNYSKGVYKENLLRKSKIHVNNQSIISDLHNKSALEECEDEFTSKRVADIIKKTKSILGRSASHKFRSKSKEINKSNKKSSILTVLKSEKASAAANLTQDYSDKESQNNEKNYYDNNNNYNNHYDGFSDPERKIKPRGFETNSALAEIQKSKEKRKKSSVVKMKSKSKSKSKAALKKHIYSADLDHNAGENFVTFTNSNTNLTSYKDTPSRVGRRKINDTSGILNYNKNKILATGSNRSFTINSYGNKSKLYGNKITEQKDKEKILKLKERNNELKLNLKNERNKHQDLEKKLKKIKFKEENFDCIEKNFIALQKDFEKMQKNYSQSELIRKEQAKLIKSMKYEIELLKEGR